MRREERERYLRNSRKEHDNKPETLCDALPRVDGTFAGNNKMRLRHASELGFDLNVPKRNLLQKDAVGRKGCTGAHLSSTGEAIALQRMMMYCVTAADDKSSSTRVMSAQNSPCAQTWSRFFTYFVYFSPVTVL